VPIISRLSKVKWIADVLSPSAVILMEVFWLYPWLLFIGKQPVVLFHRTPLSVFSLIILLGSSFIVNRYFMKRKWPMLLIQACIMACGLAVILLVLRIEYSAGFSWTSTQWFVEYGKLFLKFFTNYHPFVFAIAAGFYLWWRGISLSRSELYFNSIYVSFLVQLATLVLLIVIWGFTFKKESFFNMTSDIGIYVAGFFFFGLAALALSNLRIIQEKIKTKGEASKNFGRRWLSIIFTVIGTILVAGIGFASIFSPGFFSSLGKMMNVIYDVLYNTYTNVINIIFYAVGFITEWIYYIGAFLISLLTRGKKPEPPQAAVLGNAEDTKKIVKGSVNPTVLLVLKILIALLIIGVVIYLIARTIRRRRLNKPQDDIDEEHESVWSWSGFKDDLMVFFRALFSRFRNKTKPATANVSINWQADEDIKRRMNVREIYQHLLWHGARLRMPREESETPSEYAVRLGKNIPDGKEPVNEITDLYIDVRYGEHQTEEKKTDEANSIWDKLLNFFKGKEGST
jgi:hypothetical protein